MGRMGWVPSLVVATSALIGCGPSKAGVSDGGGAGGLAACGVDDGPSVGDGCNTLMANGACVTAQVVSTGTPPTPAGGAPVAGTYELTGVTVYGNSLGGSLRYALSLSNVTSGSLTYDSVTVSGTQTLRFHAAGTTSGTALTLTSSCPLIDGGETTELEQFTATSTGLTLFQPNNAAMQVFVFEKS
jgi:hypothetical protein